MIAASRRWRWLGGAAALAALWPAAPLRADVMEVGAQGARWIAGGEQAAPNRRAADATDHSDAQGVRAAPRVLAMIPQRYRSTVLALSARYDLSPMLIEALVWQESRWREAAVSPKGARGLAQLMPMTARDLGVDPDDPYANLEGGARYLREQLDRFGGNLELALAAYNAGPARVEAARGVPPIVETRNYVASVMARLARYGAAPVDAGRDADKEPGEADQ